MLVPFMVGPMWLPVPVLMEPIGVCISDSEVGMPMGPAR